MAYYAALVSLIGLLEDVIHGYHQYAKLHLELDTIFKSIYQKSIFLEEALKDYSSKGGEEGDRVEGLIKDAAERAKDIILSMISMEFELRKSHRSTSIFGGLIRYAAEKIGPSLLDWSTSSKLKEVEQEIDSIVGELEAIKEKQRREKTRLDYDHSAHTASLEQAAPDGGHSMVGFHKYQNTIKEQLCGQSSRLQLIPIVGAGGIGKTTLARHIFDDSLVREHFDYRGWTTVSQDYRVKDVLNTLIKSLGLKDDKGNKEDGKATKEDDESVLKMRIYQFLKGRRFLVIVDDIWSSNVWDDMKRIFPDDCNGSRIMLTTRELEVAEYAGASDFVHEVQLLSEKESWDLLQNKVFGQDCCPVELEYIGRTISSKCSGLPLAIVVIAGILSKTRVPVDWEEIAKKMRQIFSKTNERLSSILSLSYYHLPHQLKACFLHMGSFPEDFVISVSSLIRLWVAEGLLKSPDESKTIESFGEECLKDLVKRNLVIITKKRANREFKTCVLHDLLRDFCRGRASDEYFFNSGYDGDFEKIRRCILHGNASYLECHPSDVMKRLLSFLWFRKPINESEFNEMNWDRFKQLEIFCTYGIWSKSRELPKAILRMPHLKHLMLHHSAFDLRVPYIRIPPSILDLQNLQTLVIEAYRRPVEAPPEIWKMTKLRHLIIPNKVIMPPVLVDGETPGTKLESLQTLMKVDNIKYTNEVINTMPNLRKLKTQHIGLDGRWDKCNLNNLSQLLQLEELNISFGMFDVRVGSFPNGIAFPGNLKKLSLYGCRFPWECIKVVSSLPNLLVLRLRHGSCIGRKWKLTDGEFHSLKFLLLEKLDLKYWRAESSHFPCLEHLKIRQCSRLVEIPQEIGDIPTLKHIDIYDSLPEVEDSVTQIQREQKDQGNYMLQVLINRN